MRPVQNAGTEAKRSSMTNTPGGGMEGMILEIAGQVVELMPRPVRVSATI